MLDLIDNAERLTRVFGAWPSFHDAEVVRVVFDRSHPLGPMLEAQVHVFEMTSEISSAGYYVLKNHTLVTLRFAGVVLETFAGFNQQNVLWDLEISPIDPAEHDGCRLTVHMPTSYGMTASFQCKHAEVIDVQPYDEQS